MKVFKKLTTLCENLEVPLSIRKYTDGGRVLLAMVTVEHMLGCVGPKMGIILLCNL